MCADPEVFVLDMQREHEFVILACDGLWDVMSSARAVEIVRLGLRRHNDPQKAVDELVDLAVNTLHSSDNVTAIVVAFGVGPPPPRFHKQNSRLSAAATSGGT